MPLLDNDVKRTMTKPHRKLIKILRECGFTVEVEVNFPPKWVDCYLPDYHVAFEADGPQHSREKDLDRDAYLMAEYALPVYHVTELLLRKEAKTVYVELLGIIMGTTWSPTLIERRLVARDRGAFREAWE